MIINHTGCPLYQVAWGVACMPGVMEGTPQGDWVVGCTLNGFGFLITACPSTPFIIIITIITIITIPASFTLPEKCIFIVFLQFVLEKNQFSNANERWLGESAKNNKMIPATMTTCTCSSSHNNNYNLACVICVEKKNDQKSICIFTVI